MQLLLHKARIFLTDVLAERIKVTAKAETIAHSEHPEILTIRL